MLSTSIPQTNFRTFSDKRIAIICEIPARVSIASKASYSLIVNVLYTFLRNHKQPAYRVRVPPPAPVVDSQYITIL